MTFGWLSPEGKLYECPYYGHIGLAYDLVQRYKIDAYKLNADYGILSDDDMLLFSGWIKIGKDLISHGYAIIPPESEGYGLKARLVKVSAEQKRFLKHMYDDNPNDFSGPCLEWMKEIGIV